MVIEQAFAASVPGFLMPVKTPGRQHGGDDRHLSFLLYAHQCADYRAGYKFMAIDAAIHYKTRGNDCNVVTRLRE
jgi:hypothetical protein